MSDDKTEKKTALDLAQAKGITKFKTDEDLVNGYLELEKKLSSSKPGKNSSDEELFAKSAEFFKGTHDNEILLEGHLGEIQKEIVESLKVHPKQAAGAVATVAGKIAERFKQNNKKAVSAILADEVKKAALDKALVAAGKLDEFQKAYDKGLVTEQETKLWLKMAGQNKEIGESNDGIDKDLDKNKIKSKDPKAELFAIYSDPSHPVHHAKMPGHTEAKKTVNTLEKMLKSA